MTLNTITNNILRFCPGLHPDLVKSTIQDSYQTLCAKQWNRLNLQRAFYTSAPYGVGTASVAANGTVTGVGTAFTSSMVGSFLQIHYTDAMFRIAAVTPGVTLTLEDWTGEIVTATTYSIIKTIYSVNSLFGMVYDLSYQSLLSKKNQSFFNAIDPGRTSRSSTPLYWAYAGVVSNVIQVEIYPPPSAIVPIQVNGKYAFATLGDSDSPRLPEDLIEATSLIACYELKSINSPKEGWDKKISKQITIVGELMQLYEEEDYTHHTHPDKVKDTMSSSIFPTDDNFNLSHDLD